MPNVSKKYLEAVKFACSHHALQKYGENPYYCHLEDVEDVLRDNGFDDEEIIIGGWLHDVMEDCACTYNTINIHFGLRVAEIVFLLTDFKGKTRRERKSDKYYKELLKNPDAVTIKLADRIANINASFFGGNSKMLEMYEKEYSHFREKLFIKGANVSMWTELDNLINLLKLK